MSLKESVEELLESSTIHGLVYWSTTRRWSKFFWVLVVISGFTGAGYMIQQSFQSWSDSPIKTTIETLPISAIKSPKIIVCPPPDTYTNLNPDVQEAGNNKIDFEKYSYNMTDDFINHFQDLDYQAHSLAYKEDFKEENEYRNWYEKTR